MEKNEYLSCTPAWQAWSKFFAYVNLLNFHNDAMSLVVFVLFIYFFLADNLFLKLTFLWGEVIEEPCEVIRNNTEVFPCSSPLSITIVAGNDKRTKGALCKVD